MVKNKRLNLRLEQADVDRAAVLIEAFGGDDNAADLVRALIPPAPLSAALAYSRRVSGQGDLAEFVHKLFADALAARMTARKEGFRLNPAFVESHRGPAAVFELYAAWMFGALVPAGSNYWPTAIYPLPRARLERAPEGGAWERTGGGWLLLNPDEQTTPDGIERIIQAPDKEPQE